MALLIPFPDISPEIFSLPLGPVTLALRWYALAYVAGLLGAWIWIGRLMRRGELWPDNTAPLTAKQVEELLTWVVIGVILGGRLGFVLFYQPAYYLAYPQEILMVWTGGMSFHGGFAGVIVAGVLFARRRGVSALSLGDSFALTVFIGLFLGRVANFINGELWGKPSTLPWAMVFPDPRAQTCPPDWPAICARHPSQLYEALLEGVLLGAVMIFLAYRRGWLKTPGALVGVFFLIYGGARSVVELFRNADPQFITAGNPLGHVIRFGDTLGLTMGQVLSLPMVLIGIGFILWARRRA